jgi:hypothetical protein
MDPQAETPEPGLREALTPNLNPCAREPRQRAKIGENCGVSQTHDDPTIRFANDLSWLH